jgi:hypothetical protein
MNSALSSFFIHRMRSSTALMAPVFVTSGLNAAKSSNPDVI